MMGEGDAENKQQRDASDPPHARQAKRGRRDNFCAREPAHETGTE